MQACQQALKVIESTSSLYKEGIIFPMSPRLKMIFVAQDDAVS